MAYNSTDLKDLENHEQEGFLWRGLDFILHLLTFSPDASTSDERFAGVMLIAGIELVIVWKWLEHNNNSKLKLLPVEKVKVVNNNPYPYPPTAGPSMNWNGGYTTV